MAIGGVVINFAARTADAVRDIGNLTRELGDLDGKADGVGGKLKKGLAIGAAAVGTAMLTAGAAMVDFAKAAAEDRAEADNLARTLGKIPGVTQDMIDKNAEWIDSMEIATGVADTDLRVALSKLTLATGDLGQAQDLTAIAVDAAAGSGKNLKGITDALAKATAGNTSALERQFPWLDKNKDGTVTLDEALKGLKGAYNGAAEAATDQKPWERFDTILGQLKEKLGEALLPYLDRLSAWLKDKDNQKKLNDFVDDMVALAGAIGDVIQSLASLWGWLKSVWGQIDSLNRKWQDFLDSVNGWITWPWEKGGRWPWQRSGNPAAGPLSATATTTPRANPLYVTDEQVYRAVNQLIMRGDTRNGRARLAVP